jgi:hypothetical protein
MKIIFFLVLLVNSAFAANYAEDVSVDLSSGQTLILQKLNNPTGVVTVLNSNGKTVDSFQLNAAPLATSWIEMELVSANHLVVLSQGTNSWNLKQFTKSSVGSETWTLMDGEANGNGILFELKALSDGRLVAQHSSLDASLESKETFLIEADDSELKVIEVISTDAVQAKIKQFSSGHGIGFTAGLASGVGFAYRRHLENKLGVQVGGIAWGDQSSSMGNVGVELIRTLSLKNNIRFYALAASSVFYRKSESYDWSKCLPATPDGRPPAQDCTGVPSIRTTGTLNFGVGIGMEFHLKNNLGLTMELPLTVMLDIEKQNRWKPKGVYPVPSISLVYYF